MPTLDDMTEQRLPGPSLQRISGPCDENLVSHGELDHPSNQIFSETCCGQGLPPGTPPTTPDVEVDNGETNEELVDCDSDLWTWKDELVSGP